MNRGGGRPWWPHLTALAIPVVTSLAFWTVLPARFRANESTDYRLYYEPVARAVLAGRGLVIDDGSPALLYPPGHPLILATTFWVAQHLHVAESTAISGLLLLCLALSSLMLFLMARRVWGTRGALLASFAWATYPLILWTAKQPNSEVSFLPPFVGSIALMFAILESADAKAWRPLLAGVLTGLGMLIRPMAILLPFVLCIVIVTRATHAARPRRMVACGLLLLSTALTIAPWEAWAHARSGRWILLSTNGPPSMKDGLTFAVDPRPYRQGISVPEDVRQFMLGIYAKRMLSVGDVARAVAHEASIRPAAFVKLGGIKLARAWYGTDSQRMETPLLLVQVLYLSLLVAATWLAWRRGGQARDLAALTGLIVLYFWFMNLSSLPLARYTTPAVSLLFVLSPALLPRAIRGELSPPVETTRV